MITVALADDQEIIREGIKMILSLDIELNVLFEAGDGNELLDKMEEKQPDVILMDIRMPVMNGHEATKAIRRMKREDAATIPIIAMSADAFDDDIHTSLEAGMNSHISKPIDPDTLFGTLGDLLGLS